MPEISRFFGIIIVMLYERNHRLPHFHVRYGDREASFGVDPLMLLEGSLPPRALGMVMEWAAAHQQELLDNWDRACNRLPLARIDPLE